MTAVIPNHLRLREDVVDADPLTGGGKRDAVIAGEADLIERADQIAIGNALVGHHHDLRVEVSAGDLVQRLADPVLSNRRTVESDGLPRLEGKHDTALDLLRGLGLGQAQVHPGIRFAHESGGDGEEDQQVEDCVYHRRQVEVGPEAPPAAWKDELLTHTRTPAAMVWMLSSSVTRSSISCVTDSTRLESEL